MALYDLPLAQLREYKPEVREPADFDEFWGGGFIGPERWVEMNVRGMTGG